MLQSRTYITRIHITRTHVPLVACNTYSLFRIILNFIFFSSSQNVYFKYLCRTYCKKTLHLWYEIDTGLIINTN